MLSFLLLLCIAIITLINYIFFAICLNFYLFQDEIILNRFFLNRLLYKSHFVLQQRKERTVRTVHLFSVSYILVDQIQECNTFK
jgi:hypothetical protein